MVETNNNLSATRALLFSFLHYNNAHTHTSHTHTRSRMAEDDMWNEIDMSGTWLWHFVLWAVSTHRESAESFSLLSLWLLLCFFFFSSFFLYYFQMECVCVELMVSRMRSHSYSSSLLSGVSCITCLLIDNSLSLGLRFFSFCCCKNRTSFQSSCAIHCCMRTRP